MGTSERNELDVKSESKMTLLSGAAAAVASQPSSRHPGSSPVSLPSSNKESLVFPVYCLVLLTAAHRPVSSPGVSSLRESSSILPLLSTSAVLIMPSYFK